MKDIEYYEINTGANTEIVIRKKANGICYLGTEDLEATYSELETTFEVFEAIKAAHCQDNEKQIVTCYTPGKLLF